MVSRQVRLLCKVALYDLASLLFIQGYHDAVRC
jgi:hypothetical protein